MKDIEKLIYTLDKMSAAAAELLKTDATKVDSSWISGFIASVETTLEALE